MATPADATFFVRCQRDWDHGAPDWWEQQKSSQKAQPNVEVCLEAP